MVYLGDTFRYLQTRVQRVALLLDVSIHLVPSGDSQCGHISCILFYLQMYLTVEVKQQ